MSQHLFTTTLNGRPVEVLAGWDRPLQGYFLTVSIPPEPDHPDDDDDWLYSNLADVALLPGGGMAPDFSYYERKLEELHLEVPCALIEQVRLDAQRNTGNRFVRYGADGTVLFER